MTQNQCEHIRPDGARCQAPLQTGRSFCFFHDPEQQEKRATARRNGGFMRDHLSREAVEAYRTPSRTDDPPLLPVDVPYLYVRTHDDVTDRLEEIFNRPLETQQDRDRARVQLYALSIQSANHGSHGEAGARGRPRRRTCRPTRRPRSLHKRSHRPANRSCRRARCPTSPGESIPPFST